MEPLWLQLISFKKFQFKLVLGSCTIVSYIFFIIHVFVYWYWENLFFSPEFTTLVRTHNRPGVFYRPGGKYITCMPYSLQNWFKQQIAVHPLVPTAPDNEMSRNISQLTAGTLCVEIYSHDNLTGKFELLNLDTKGLETSVRVNNTDSGETRLEFDNLQPGNYQLFFRNIQREIHHIQLFPSKN
jgi:hypothetical protein